MSRNLNTGDVYVTDDAKAARADRLLTDANVIKTNADVVVTNANVDITADNV